MRISDGSSGVCSSDLHPPQADGLADTAVFAEQQAAHGLADDHVLGGAAVVLRVEARALADLPVVDREPVRLHALPVGRGIVLGEHDLGAAAQRAGDVLHFRRSEEHTSELQSLMRNSNAVFWLN